LAQGKRFVFANPSQYDSMDPNTHADVGRIAVRLNLYDGCTAGSTTRRN